MEEKLMSGKMDENIKLIISEGDIEKRCIELATEIENDYKGEEIVIICVLNGSAVFTADLSRKISKIPVFIDFFYISDIGEVKVADFEKQIPLNSKNIIVVEDVVDTGETLCRITEYMKKQNPKSIKVCSLLRKAKHSNELNIDYLGFDIDIDDFNVVGFGMDFNGKYRDLPYIGVLMDVI